jgi:hypothetical protein
VPRVQLPDDQPRQTSCASPRRLCRTQLFSRPPPPCAKASAWEARPPCSTGPPGADLTKLFCSTAAAFISPAASGAACPAAPPGAAEAEAKPPSAPRFGTCRRCDHCLRLLTDMRTENNRQHGIQTCAKSFQRLRKQLQNYIVQLRWASWQSAVGGAGPTAGAGADAGTAAAALDIPAGWLPRRASPVAAPPAAQGRSDFIPVLIYCTQGLTGARIPTGGQCGIAPPHSSQQSCNSGRHSWSWRLQFCEPSLTKSETAAFSQQLVAAPAKLFSHGGCKAQGFHVQ